MRWEVACHALLEVVDFDKYDTKGISTDMVQAKVYEQGYMCLCLEACEIPPGDRDRVCNAKL